MILLGDCLVRLKELPDNSVDSVVTDPPWAIKFMSKRWDYEIPSIDVWREVLRVLKPGGHALVCCGTRTQHRMVASVEDAGFDIKDVVVHLYGSGFPKSLNVQKSARSSGLGCDCEAAAEHELQPVSGADVQASVSTQASVGCVLQSCVPEQDSHEAMLRTESEEGHATREESSLEGRSDLQTVQGKLRRPEVCPVSQSFHSNGQERRLHNGAPTGNGGTSKAALESNGSGPSPGPQHEKQSHRKSGTISSQSGAQNCRRCGKAIIDSGLGTALKPAAEFWTLARKPLEKGLTVAQNALKYGTGALNIDACRVATKDSLLGGQYSGRQRADANCYGKHKNLDAKDFVQPQGRWPANLILDECAAELLDEQSGYLHPAGNKKPSTTNGTSIFGIGLHEHQRSIDSKGGGASRFFYCAKASKSERNAGLDCIEIINVSIGSWENADLKAQLQVDTAQSPPKVIDASGTLNNSVCEWNTLLFGNDTSDQLKVNSRSTIKTERNSTTESKTLNWLLRCNTSAITLDANLLEISGGSPADHAESLNLSSNTINGATAIVMSANPAQSNAPLQIKGAGALSCSHPTVKPLKLMEYLIKLITPPNGTVLDPFMGSGSTGVAAFRLGFKFIGIEMNAEYVEIAEKRIAAVK